MALTARENSGAQSSPIPEGLHMAYCCGLYDIGEQHNEKFNKLNRQVVISWALPNETISIQGMDEPRIVSKTYTLSLGDRSNLRAHLKSWRGRDFTPEELEGFDLVKIVGAPCQIQIIHEINGDRTYANIAAIVPYPKGMPPIEKPILPRVFDLDTSPISELQTLPQWIQERIMKSPTYASLMNCDTAAGDYLEDSFASPQPQAASYEEEERKALQASRDAFMEIVEGLVGGTTNADEVEAKVKEHFKVNRLTELQPSCEEELRAIVDKYAVPF